MAGIHLAQGKGITELMAQSDFPSSFQYVTLNAWPPAYSIGISIFYPLVGDAFLADQVMGGLGICLIFVSCYLIFVYRISDYKLSFPFLLLMVWWSFSFTPFHFLYNDEVWALGLLGLSTFCMLSRKQMGEWWIVGAIGLLVLAVFFRFAYFPFLILPWIVLIVQSPIHKFKPFHWPLPWYFSALLTISCLITLGAFSTPTHGQGRDYTISFEGNWENLFAIDEFPLKALIYLDIGSLWQGYSISSYSSATYVEAGVLILACILFLLIFFPVKRGDKLSVIFLCIFFLNVGFLMVLSVLIPAEVHDHQYIWTYVAETRYFAPAMWVIQCRLCIRLGQCRDFSWRTWGLLTIWMLAVGYGLTHYVYKYQQRIYDIRRQFQYQESVMGERCGPMLSEEEMGIFEEEQHLKLLYEFVRARVDQGEKVVWVNGSYVLEEAETWIAALGGAAVWRWEEDLGDDHNYTEPITLLCSLNEVNMAKFVSKIQNSNLEVYMKKEYTCYGQAVFIISVSP